MDFKINESSQYKVLLDAEKEEERLGIHSFHRYYGKLIPAIPSAFIKAFTEEGETVFDPFSGSGTTAVESLKLNRNFVGVEINPLSHKIASVKTSPLNPEVLSQINDEILDVIRQQPETFDEAELPFLQNRDHWFKDFVQRDLIRIKKGVDFYFSAGNGKKLENKELYKSFYLVTVSAIIRNVSNADTMHVFPGVSKRMRRLEAEGKIHIDVLGSFERAIKKRASYFGYNAGDARADILLGDSTTVDLTDYKESVSLIVTNPPYISSVRYIETLKLEMYWMEYIRSTDEYSELAHKMLGNDRLQKNEYQSIPLTPYDEINAVICDMENKDKKSAKILSEFFLSMELVIKQMQCVLKSGGKVVIKISDSKMKKTKIETGKLMTLIAAHYGFRLVDVFLDEINNNSRSLTTARNTYSDIITNDYIIIWEKI